LVEKSSVEALLNEVRASGHRDVFLAGGLASLGERGLEAVRDEDERRATLLLHGLPRVVGENEHRHAERGIVSPPPVRDRIVFPRALAAAEHAPAHEDRPGRVQRFAHHLVVRVPLSSRHSVAFAKARKSEDPFVEAFATDAERLLYRPVRAGDEAVQ
jgi:hypothetical protein